MGQKALSWKAVQRGTVRCAPACGAGCTQAAFELATKRAEALCKKLGDGWTPRVYENLGWHASVVGCAGHLKVHINVRGDTRTTDSAVYGYTAFLNPDANGVGGVWAESGKTPEAAIKNTIAKMLAQRDELNEIYAVVEAEGYMP